MTELELLRTDPNYYSSLYRQHRVAVFAHLKQFTPDEDYIADLYQDAIIVLLERVRDPYFQLTCSVKFPDCLSFWHFKYCALALAMSKIKYFCFQTEHLWE